MARKTLVVIDMQPHFLDTLGDEKDKLTESVTKIIKRKARLNHPVVLVELNHSRQRKYTHGAIFEALNGFHYHLVQKNSQDGSNEIVKLLREKRLPRSHVEICGIYFEACIRETVIGMSRLMPRAEIGIIRDGCSCITNRAVIEEAEWIRTLSNVKLV
jgi:nicotinamidase-related amidase